MWVIFAPVQAGGQAAYIIVAGASMNPALRRGDLVIARQAVDYQVGEIVAYRHPTIGPIIHRIVATQDGAFTLKGDANTWVDSYTPFAAEIMGKEWIRLPGVGRILTWLRQPVGLSLAAVLISLLIVTTVVPMSAPERRQTKRKSAKGSRSPAPVLAASAGTLQTVIFILGIVSLLSVLLAIAAWTHPLSREAIQAAAYKHLGVFTYSGTVPHKVYGETRLESGEPVYLRLTRFVDIWFDYRLSADEPHSVRGTAQLMAEISDANGWHRAIELRRVRTFEGESIRLAGALDLNVISTYLQDLEAETGVTRPFYTLTVYPEITIQGDLAGNALESTFAPSLKFMVDKLQMQLQPGDPGAPGADPMKPIDEGAVDTVVVEPNRLSALGATVPVTAARWVAGIGMVIGLGGLALLGLWLYLQNKVDPAAAIHMKYGAQMAEVQAGSFDAGRGSQELASFDDLARVAEKSDQMIQWIATDEGRDYFVQQAHLLYHFRLLLPPKPNTADEAPAVSADPSGKDTGQ